MLKLKNILIFFLLSSVFSFISIIFTGFVFGKNNNLFHLPILFSLPELPQFKDDLFIQSLRFYSSGFWQSLAGLGLICDLRIVLFLFFIFSRILFFIGFFLCCSLINKISFKSGVFLGTVCCVSPFSYGLSYAGDGGLFIDYFTHSEFTNGLTMLFIFCLCNRKYCAGGVLNGIISFFNFFIAAWNFFVFLFIGILFRFRKIIILKRGYLSYFLGGLAFFVFLLPTIFNIVKNPCFGKSLGFSFKSYLLYYWPFHSLAQSIPVLVYFKLFLVFFLCGFSFFYLKPRLVLFEIVFFAFTTLYCLGVLVSFIWPTYFVLNLNILRSSVVFHFFAVFLFANVFYSFFKSRDLSRFVMTFVS